MTRDDLPVGTLIYVLRSTLGAASGDMEVFERHGALWVVDRDNEILSDDALVFCRSLADNTKHVWFPHEFTLTPVKEQTDGDDPRA